MVMPNADVNCMMPIRPFEMVWPKVDNIRLKNVHIVLASSTLVLSTCLHKIVYVQIDRGLIY